jgi:drug/metabolite transporter (DMT)-like permease
MSLLGWSLLLGLSALWGASFWFIEVGLASVPPMTLVLIRVVSGGLALLLFLLASRRGLPLDGQFWGRAAIMGLLNNVLPFCLIAWGQLFISAGMAAILNAHTAFAAVWIAALFIASETLRLHRIAGVVIGICGVVLVIGPENIIAMGQMAGTDQQLWGQMAVLAATFSYALAGVWGKLKLAGRDVLQTACATLLCASLWLAPVVLWRDGLPPAQLLFDAGFMSAMLTLGLAGTALAYWLYFRLLELTGASNLALVTIIVPVFAVALDALLLGVLPGLPVLAGFGVVAIGMAVLDGRLPARLIKGRAAR